MPRFSLFSVSFVFLLTLWGFFPAPLFSLGANQTTTLELAVRPYSWNKASRGFVLLEPTLTAWRLNIQGDLLGESRKKGGLVLEEKFPVLTDKGEVCFRVDIPEPGGEARTRRKEIWARNKRGWVQIVMRVSASGEEVFGYFEYQQSGTVYERRDYGTNKKLLRIHRAYPGEGGLIESRQTLDPRERLLHLARYRHKDGITNGWLRRHESAFYADVSGHPKEALDFQTNVSLAPTLPIGVYSWSRSTASDPAPKSPPVSLEPWFDLADQLASQPGAGAQILTEALKRIREKTIIRGSCYDWINLIYKHCGFTNAYLEKVALRPEKGPYLDPTFLKPGDWIMFKNLTYGGIGHSGIFLDWIDWQTRSAMVLGYAGESREMPGRFREYDLSQLFGIYRGKNETLK